MNHIFIKLTLMFAKISSNINTLMMKILGKLNAIAIIQVNIKVLHVAYVI